MVSFISGDVGLAPAFKEPEESMSTSPQATILAMEQQQSRAEVNRTPARSQVELMLKLLASLLPLLFQLRLEALHQIVVLISGMEEKGSQPGSADRSSSSFQSSSLLTSVRLQFLAGCFGLGTVGAGGLKRESVQLHHYQVQSCSHFQIDDCFPDVSEPTSVHPLSQDGVKAAKRSIQMEIQTAVHKIYQQLSVTLERALQANKHHIGNKKYDCAFPGASISLNQLILLMGQYGLNNICYFLPLTELELHLLTSKRHIKKLSSVSFQKSSATCSRYYTHNVGISLLEGLP